MSDNRLIEFVALHAFCGGTVSQDHQIGRTDARCSVCGTSMRLDLGATAESHRQMVDLCDRMRNLLDYQEDFEAATDPASDVEILRRIFQRNPRLARFLENVIVSNDQNSPKN